jgi:glucosamine--fructose-6-phosphate aminotransferase (isomerizing)
MGVVNVVGSKIATSVHCGVYLNSGREVAVAATKSFTSQVCVLLLIACWMSAKKEERDGTCEYKYMRKGLLD